MSALRLLQTEKQRLDVLRWIDSSYDYDPCRSCLTIRMPTPLHDTFCAKLVDEISSQLKQFQEDREVATFAREVEHFATSRIFIPEDSEDGERRYIRREPDASFGHRRAHYPGVIIEVCYSQKRRQISRLADDYILNTDGSVNVVVCLDIDYKGSKKATISVWRPEYVTIDGVEEFRTNAVVEAQVRSCPIEHFTDSLLTSCKGLPDSCGMASGEYRAATIPQGLWDGGAHEWIPESRT